MEFLLSNIEINLSNLNPKTRKKIEAIVLCFINNESFYCKIIPFSLLDFAYAKKILTSLNLLS